MNEYEKKLRIAKFAYKEIMETCNELQRHFDNDICFHWDECISVDDELFHGHQLREDKCLNTE